jgi:flavodoxin
MRALIVVDSAYGNTERIATAMATALLSHGRVVVERVAEAPLPDPTLFDLLLVGGPTQRHGLSPALDTWLGGLGRRTLGGLAAAAFDTRYRMPAVLSGSAAGLVGRRLVRAGCRLVAPPESFFVERDQPPSGGKRRHELEQLEEGETERAASWAEGLIQKSG